MRRLRDDAQRRLESVLLPGPRQYEPAPALDTSAGEELLPKRTPGWASLLASYGVGLPIEIHAWTGKRTIIERLETLEVTWRLSVGGRFTSDTPSTTGPEMYARRVVLMTPEQALEMAILTPLAVIKSFSAAVFLRLSPTGTDPQPAQDALRALIERTA